MMPLLPALFLLAAAGSAIFGKWWTPADIASFQKDLLQHANLLDASVKTCAKLDDAHKSSWQEFLTKVTNFCNTNFGWVTTTHADGTTTFGGGDKATADMAQQLSKELYEWGVYLQGQGCNLTGPNTAPPGDPNQGIKDIAKYVAIAAGFVGTAYVVGQVLTTVRVFKGASPKA